MAPDHNPISGSAAATALSPDDRLLLDLLFHATDCSLSQIAEHLGLSLLELTARILAEPFQAALASIEQAAASVARARALVSGSTAVSALTAAATSDNPSFAERRRAGAALLRFAPPPPASVSNAPSVTTSAKAPPDTAALATDPLPSPSPAPAAAASTPAAHHQTSSTPSREQSAPPAPQSFLISSTNPTPPARNARDRPSAAVA